MPYGLQVFDRLEMLNYRIYKHALEPRPELESGFPAYKTGTSPYMFTGQKDKPKVRFERTAHKKLRPDLPAKRVYGSTLAQSL